MSELTFSRLVQLRNLHAGHVAILVEQPDSFSCLSRDTMSPESSTYWGQIVGKSGLRITVIDDRPERSGRSVVAYLVDRQELEKSSAPASSVDTGANRIAPEDAQAFADEVARLLNAAGWRVLAKNNEVHWAPTRNSTIIELEGYKYKDISGDRAAIKDAVLKSVHMDGNMRVLCENYVAAGKNIGVIQTLKPLLGPSTQSLSSPRPGF